MPKADPNDRDLSSMRAPYLRPGSVFLESQIESADPVKLFANWFDHANTSLPPSSQCEPNAVQLSTVNAYNEPSSRTVLCKGFSAAGFRFCTNSDSRKGRDLAQNPNAAMLFYFPWMYRQIRVEGKVEKLSPDIAKQVWLDRPVESRHSSSISRQSQPIDSRESLEQKVNASMTRYGDDVPMPTTWTAYCLVPRYFEFWQGQTDRLHDRIEFTLEANGWSMKRLQP